MLKIIALAALMIGLSVSQAGNINWEKFNKEDGITVWRAEMPGTPIIAFKGKVLIDASIRKVLWVLADKAHRRDWVDRLDINEELEIISPTKRVIYQSFKMPFLISNRDMVYQIELTKNRKNGNYFLKLQSINHKKSPKTIGVRAQLINSQYKLVPKGKHQTEVTVEILSDPKGMLPAWLVNLVQKSWPVKTLRGLRNQVKKDFVKEYKAL
ncbi:MAG: hypothetical protein HN576_15480 [Bacteriovoracaceae bacterium]|nr:hypothetical protein [Bacteriovoracaceae bacterium]